ncbi:MAG TPA: hypothetical protein PLU30_24945 [Verrucomicrobiae bacterium]|nr:hypothetical protein [Verrucomicrobiae bacterium]
MERVANKARSHAEAEAWDRRQRLAMSVLERTSAAAELRRRVFGNDHPDVRAWHRKK